MPKHKLPKMAPFRPDEEAYLKRWKGVKKTLGFFEKMHSDPVYNSAVASRTTEDGEHKIGSSWGIGKPKAPN